MLIYWCVFSVLCVTSVRAAYSYNASEMTVRINGYVVESHDVTTADGYILGVRRIPYGRDLTSLDNARPVVLLMHGFAGLWRDYIEMGPEAALGYNLVDAGFDVWFGNARGNVYSRRHASLDPDDPLQKKQFFDFSWEEIGLNDLPAMIDYILKYTVNKKLHYIGGSQGGTEFLVLGSMKPEYNEKMASVHLLSGLGYQEHFPDKEIMSVAPDTDILYGFSQAVGQVEVTEDIMSLLNATDLIFCWPKDDYLVEPVDPAIKASNSSDEFYGTSLKTLFHYFQNIRDKQFRRFHYGTENVAKYGSPEPPAYDLSLITSDVTMHYAPADKVVDERDVLAMVKDMPHAVARRVQRDTFAHDDFVLTQDSKVLVTDFIIEAIKKVHKS